MKKLILCLIVLMPFLAKAEVPDGVYGFLDGKLYDKNQTLIYNCFMDGSCFDVNGQFAFNREAPSLPATTMPAPILPSNPIPVPVIVDPVSPPVFVGGGAITPSCTITEVQRAPLASDLPPSDWPTNVGWVKAGLLTTVTWTTQGIDGISTSTPGKLTGLTGQKAGVPIYEVFGFLNSPNGTLENQFNGAKPYKAVFGNVSCIAN